MTNEDKYKCKELDEDQTPCNKTFKSPAGLGSHLFHVHGIRGKQSKKPKKTKRKIVQEEQVPEPEEEYEPVEYEEFEPFAQPPKKVKRPTTKYPDQKKRFYNMLLDIIPEYRYPKQSLTEAFFYADNVEEMEDPKRLYKKLIDFEIPPTKRLQIMQSWYHIDKDEVIKLDKMVGKKKKIEDSSEFDEFEEGFDMTDDFGPNPKSMKYDIWYEKQKMRLDEERRRRDMQNRKDLLELKKLELELEQLKGDKPDNTEKDKVRPRVLPDGSTIHVTDSEWLAHVQTMKRLDSDKNEDEDANEYIPVPFRGKVIKAKRKDVPMYMAYDDMQGGGGSSPEIEALRKQNEEIKRDLERERQDKLRGDVLGLYGELKKEIDNRDDKFKMYKQGVQEGEGRKSQSENIVAIQENTKLLEKGIQEGRLARKDSSDKVDKLLSNPIIQDEMKHKLNERRQRGERFKDGLPPQDQQELAAQQLMEENHQEPPPQLPPRNPPPQYPEEGYEHYEPPPPDVNQKKELEFRGTVKSGQGEKKESD